MNGHVGVSGRLEEEVLKYRLSMVHLDRWKLQPLESVKPGYLASFQGYGTKFSVGHTMCPLSSPEVELKIGLKR